MKQILYLIFTLVATLFVAVEAQAQKYPERSRVRRGNRAYERLDYDRAEERYKQAIELSDSCFEAKFNLGDALYTQQRYDEAEKVFTALATDSTRSDLDRAHSYYNLGNSLFQQKKYQEALSAFKRSLRLNPADLETKYNYAYTKKYIEDNQQNGGGGGDNNQDQNQQNNQGGGDNQQDQQDNQQNDQNNQNNNDQQNNNNDQNKDDQQGDGDQNKDQNQDPNKDQNQDGDNDQQNGEGDDERDQNGDQDPNQDPQQGDGESEPQPSGLSQNDAERMLDAIQGEEDKTRDKVNAKVGQGVVRSGKNW